MDLRIHTNTHIYKHTLTHTHTHTHIYSTATHKQNKSTYSFMLKNKFIDSYMHT